MEVPIIDYIIAADRPVSKKPRITSFFPLHLDLSLEEFLIKKVFPFVSVSKNHNFAFKCLVPIGQKQLLDWRSSIETRGDEGKVSCEKGVFEGKISISENLFVKISNDESKNLLSIDLLQARYAAMVGKDTLVISVNDGSQPSDSLFYLTIKTPEHLADFFAFTNLLAQPTAKKMISIIRTKDESHERVYVSANGITLLKPTGQREENSHQPCSTVTLLSFRYRGDEGLLPFLETISNQLSELRRTMTNPELSKTSNLILEQMFANQHQILNSDDLELIDHRLLKLPFLPNKHENSIISELVASFGPKIMRVYREMLYHGKVIILVRNNPELLNKIVWSFASLISPVNTEKRTHPF